MFEFLREPANLPRWAHAFVSAENGRARLETPAGAVDVGLAVTADADTGVIDWRLAFPEQGEGHGVNMQPALVAGERCDR